MLEDFFLPQNLTQSIAVKYNGLERKKKSKQHRDPALGSQDKLTDDMKKANIRQGESGLRVTTGQVSFMPRTYVSTKQV